MSSEGRPPVRQRQVAWAIIRDPELLHRPKLVAEKLGCTPNTVKMAVHKLQNRIGTIDTKRLCPECLTHSRIEGVCHTCGVELPREKSFQSVFSHEIRNRIHEGFSTTPIAMSYQTKRYLEGNERERLKRFCLSRLDQLFKEYMPRHEIVNAAAFICEGEIESYLGDSTTERISREDKLAIMTRTLLACSGQMPAHSAMWSGMLGELLTMPRVVLYG